MKTNLPHYKEEAREALKDHKGKDSPLKDGFFDRRVEAFAKSLDGKWIYRLKNDDDDETNWYLLEDITDHLIQHQNALLESTYKRGKEDRDIIPFEDALNGKTAMVMVGTYAGKPIMFANADHETTLELIEIIREAALKDI